MHVLIHIMSAPSGVMDISRALRISQPTVSEHVRVLVAADLLRRERRNNRIVYVASPRRVERLLEDAGATLVRWSGKNY
jgi:DNA-binding MarR family transcriptional regulator